MKLLAAVAIAVIALIGSAEAAKPVGPPEMKAWCQQIPYDAFEIMEWMGSARIDAEHRAQQSKNLDHVKEFQRVERQQITEGTYWAMTYLAFCKPPPQ